MPEEANVELHNLRKQLSDVAKALAWETPYQASLAERATALKARVDALEAERGHLREVLRAVITPALLGLINEGDDEPAGMPDDAAVDVTGNGFRCQITVGDIRKASTALTAA